MTGGWRKSSYSIGNGNCVEVAAWRKSRRSAANGNCVEVGQGPAAVGVRDSKLGDASPVLAFPGSAWDAFLAHLKGGPVP